jgi:hypothetical protein
VTVALLSLLCAPLAVLAAPAAPAAPADAVAATDGPVWTATAQRALDARPRTVRPRAYAAYTLDRAALRARLGTGRVEVPDPDGELVAFDVTETAVMEPGLAAAHPELRTWAGVAVHGTATVRLDVTPAGVHVSVRGAGPAWYVDPAHRGDDGLHLSYAGADLPAPERPLVEPTLPRRTADQLAAAAEPHVTPSLGEGPGEPVELRTYRLALLSDPTYAQFTAPGAATNAASDSAVLAAKVTLVNRLSQLYGDDLGIRLLLVDGTDTTLNLWTTAEATGANGPCGRFPCFTPALLSGGCTLPLLDRQHWVVGQLVGARNYDVGHLALGINGGGVAYLDGVGHESKAGGCTGLSTPTGDAYAVDFLAHELGHQFGADHTFDGGTAGCAGNRATASAVEPGSGSTIMGYAGICGADDLQSRSDPVFSHASQDAIELFVNDASFAVRELQSVALTAFDGADSFRLSYGGASSPLITRGGNYTASGIANAALAVLPAGSTVSVLPFFNEGALDDRGFTLAYNFYGSTFYGNVPEPTVVVGGGTFASAVNDIDAGDPSTTANGGAVTTTTNHTPTVTAPADRTIPVRTPFTLSGSAADVDGSPLRYVWEQTDASGSASAGALHTEPKTAGPLFRVFGTSSATYTNVPSETGETRSFPDLAQVLAADTNAATGSCPAGAGQVNCLSEWLPTAAYAGSALHFRLTARDASTQGGGVASDDVTLALAKTAGPFRVTSQATPGTALAGGSQLPVAWDVNNSQALAAEVKVSLVRDSDPAFSYVLWPATANDGATTVNLPDLSIGDARIKVEAVDNYFYDLGDATFAIQSAGGPAPLVVDRTALPANISTQFSDAPAGLGLSATSGLGPDAIVATSSGLPAGLTLSAPSVTGATASWTVTGAPTAPPGSYPATITLKDRPEPDLGQTISTTINVTPETATVTYTGPTLVTAGDWQDDEVPVALSAQVTQAADGQPGALTAATVTFTDVLTGDDLCAAPGPVSAAGVATCTFAADLSASDSVQFKVRETVGGAYTGTSASDVVVTAELPEEPEAVPPQTLITSGPAGWLLATSATFGYSSSAPGSDFLCRLDGVRVQCQAPSVTLTGLSQRTHSFSVLAEDEDGDRDQTPATRDFAVPVDDAGLAVASGKWKRKKRGSAYLGTCSEARKKGASLGYQVNGARELALLVSTGKRYGAVKVYLDGALLATVKTAGRPGTKLVRLAHLPSPRSGTVRIVTTSGRTVRVDGLGVSTAAF